MTQEIEIQAEILVQNQITHNDAGCSNVMFYFYKLISAIAMAFFLKCIVTENNAPLSEIGQVICFQTQSFVNSKLCSKTLPISFPSSFFLHPSRFRKNPHAVIVLAAAGYLPSGSTFIYGRDSFFFVILYCNRAHMQEALHPIQFLVLRGPSPPRTPTCSLPDTSLSSFQGWPRSSFSVRRVWSPAVLPKGGIT